MEIFSDSDDDGDSDSDQDRRAYPTFDYDARFRPLECLDVWAVRDQGPEAELRYILEDFAFNVEGQLEREARYNREANNKEVYPPVSLIPDTRLTRASSAI